MNRKIFISSCILGLIIFSFTLCFATDGSVGQDLGNGVRDVVDGAGNASKDAINAVESGINTMTQQGNNNNTSKDTNNNTNQNSYTAQRTSTNGSVTFFGMNATTWTWIILAIAAIAIIALVWYYSTQTRLTEEEHHE